MAKILYVLNDGSEHLVDAPEGVSVMLCAIQNNIHGIDAECGGCCSCATCHVYVSERDFKRLPPPGSLEVELLSGVAAERRPNSRLSCQIIMSNELDGIMVYLPDCQSS